MREQDWEKQNKSKQNFVKTLSDLVFLVNNGHRRYDPEADLKQRVYQEEDPIRESILKNLKQDSYQSLKTKFQTIKFENIEPHSLNLFDLEKNSFRFYLLVLFDSKLWKVSMIIVVLLNSILLGFQDFADLENKTERNQILYQVYVVFDYLFILEASLKIIAYGAYSMPTSYFRNPWSRFNFILTLVGGIQIFFPLFLPQFIRAIIAMRPVRLIKDIKSMKRIAQVIFKSTISLINVGILFFFAIFMFALIGKNQYLGRSFSMCRSTEVPVNATYWPKTDQMCNPTYQDCGEGFFCGSPSDYGISLDDDGVSKNASLNYGVVNFDSFASSLLLVFQLSTNSGWPETMYVMIETYGLTSSLLYFTTLILFCFLILLNMVLAVITDSFKKYQQEMLDYRRNKLQTRVNHKLQMLCFLFRMKVLWQIKRHNMKLKEAYEESQGVQIKRYDENGKPYKRQYWISFTQVVCLIVLQQRFEALKDEDGFIQFNKDGAVKMKDKGLQKISNKYTIDRFYKTVKKQKSKPFLEETREEKLERITNRIYHRYLAKKHLEEKKRQFNLNESSISDQIQMRLIDQIMHKINEQMSEKMRTKLNMNSNLAEAIIKNRKFSQEGEENKIEDTFSDNLSERSLPVKQENTLLNKFKNSTKSKVKEVQIQEEEEKSSSDNASFSFSDEDDMDSDSAEDLDERIRKRQAKSLKSMRNRISTYKPDMSLRKRQTIYAEDERNLSWFQKKYRQVEDKVNPIVESDWFSFFIMTAIVTNTIIMSTEQVDMTEQHEKSLENANYFFATVFTIEMLLKLIGLSPREYCKSSSNLFDAVLIIIALVEISLQQNLSLRGLTVLRGFRVFRLLKLAQQWKSLQNLLITVIYAVRDIANLAIIFFIWLFVTSMLGAAFYANKMQFDEEGNPVTSGGETPRTNFDNMTSAFTTMFVVVQGESWQGIMYDAIRSTGYPSAFLFIALVIFGQIILFTLVTAVLIDSFNNQIQKQEEESQQNRIEQVARLNRNLSRQYSFANVKQSCFKRISDLYAEFKKYTQRRPEKEEMLNKKVKAPEDSDSEEEKDEIYGKTLFLFSQDSFFRQVCFKIQQNIFFETFILLVILFSSIMIAFDNPLAKSQIKYILEQVYIGLTVIFVFEMVLKVISKGFLFCGPNSYILDPWNVLDFIICITSVIDVLLQEGNSNLSIVKIFRLLRVIKPLRLIYRNDSVKLAMRTLLKSAPNLFQLMLILFIFFILFGIFMVNVVKGTLYSCYTDNIEFYTPQKILDKWDCQNSGGTWDKRNQNFDSFILSIQTFFDFSAGNKIGTMWLLSDSVAIDKQPIRDYSSYWILPMVCYILIFSFFFTSLYIGVVVSTFERERILYGQYHLLTENQQKWVTMKKTITNSLPLITKLHQRSRFAQLCFKIRSFFLFKFSVTGLLGIYTYFVISIDPTQEGLSSENYNIRTILLFLFLLEFFIEFTALKTHYLRDSWNRFEFAMYALTFLGYIMGETDRIMLKTYSRILICTLSLRLIKLTKGSKMMRVLLDTLVISFPSILNIGLLLLLLVYIYAILGMQLFAQVKLQDNINERANFQSFSRSFITMLRSVTGNGWDTLRNDLGNGKSILNQCKYESELLPGEEKEAIQCGNQVTASLFFFSFGLLVQQIFLNLFVAIVLQNFDERKESMEKLINYDIIQKFQKAWSNYDAKGKGFLAIRNFLNLLRDLGQPLGLNHAQSVDSLYLQKFLRQLELPTYDHKCYVQYHDVLSALSSLAFKNNEEEKYEKLLKNLPKRKQIIKRKMKEFQDQLQQFQYDPNVNIETNQVKRQSGKNNPAKIIIKTIKADIKIGEALYKVRDDIKDSKEFWLQFALVEDQPNQKDFIRYQAASKLYDIFSKQLGKKLIEMEPDQIEKMKLEAMKIKETTQILNTEARLQEEEEEKEENSSHYNAYIVDSKKNSMILQEQSGVRLLDTPDTSRLHEPKIEFRESFKMRTFVSMPVREFTSFDQKEEEEEEVKKREVIEYPGLELMLEQDQSFSQISQTFGKEQSD